MEDIKSCKRILIVNVNWLGDVLFSTVSIKAIRRRFPESFIASMVVPRCKEMLEGNPNLDEIIIFDEEGEHKGIIGKIKFIFLLKKRHFDTVFLFHRSFTRLFLCYLAGIPERIGYWRRKGGFLLTKKIEPPPSGIHRADYYLNLVKEAGIEITETGCDFFLSEDARDSVSRFLEENGVKRSDFLISVNPGANWSLKRWPLDRFAELSDRLIERYNAKIVITGSQSDIKLAQEITDKMKHTPIIASGRTNLKELGALFRFSDLVISADTGPMHIAVCMQTPLIALFGPTSPDITGPYAARGPTKVIQKDVGCNIPCYNLDCKQNRCMQAITVDDVLKAIEELKIYPLLHKR